MTIPHDLPGDPPPEDDAVDLAARLIELINRYPHDAQGRRHLDEVRCVLDDHMKADDTIPAWRPVETWPNNGPGWARTRWIISQMLPASRVTLFSGEGAAGKTRIVMQLVVSLARGFPSPFLKKEPVQNSPHFDDALDQGGNPVPDWKGGKVVWGTWETAPGDFQERLHAAAAMTPLQKLSGEFGFNNMRPHGALWGPEQTLHISTRATLLDGGRKLLDYAENFKASILVLDPLAAAYASNENDRSLVRPFLSHLADWADRTGCAVLIIAHPPKTGDDGYSGSTDWHNGVQSRWLLSPCKCRENTEDPCQVQKLRVVKLSEGRLPDTALSFAWDNVQRTLVLVNHDQPERKKKNSRSPTRNRSATADDGDGTPQMPISTGDDVDDVDFDLH